MSSPVPAWTTYGESASKQGHSDLLGTKQPWKKPKIDPLYI